jgi:EAL domain-containing protein (putative c-di-GMP-specific phosphodiesterase class I)
LDFRGASLNKPHPMKDKNSFPYLTPMAGIGYNDNIYDGVSRDMDINGLIIPANELPSTPSNTSEKKLVPYFQPIIGIASGNIVGYEALARQIDINGRVASAGDLFSSPNFPDEQLLTWDRLVRRQSLKQFSEANCSGYLTLNISAKWLDYITDSCNLPTLLMLNEFHVDRSRIIIEITESAGDVNKLAEMADVYRRQGLKIAIDDFGAGFSQLERLMAIQPDIIKLDMQLFKQAAKGGIASEIVHLLARLAKRTGCRIVCEGVETEDEFLFGLSCGAQFMQGYLFSPAVAEFRNPVDFQDQVNALRRKFLDDSVHKEKLKFKYINKIKKLCTLLKNAVEIELNIDELPARFPFEESGVLRFYICNNNGEQISSNFNFTDGKWLEDPTTIGFNWAWRPYFYKLLALESFKKNYRLVTSERYKDFNTDMLCKTLSLRLDNERILLIDIASNEI